MRILIFHIMDRGITMGQSFMKGFVDHLAQQNGGVPMSDEGSADGLKVSNSV